MEGVHAERLVFRPHSSPSVSPRPRSSGEPKAGGGFRVRPEMRMGAKHEWIRLSDSLARDIQQWREFAGGQLVADCRSG
ncbi:hypothetical protein Enr13x_38470 [Stieleria neptunia]|uniref:Uncharacterized protein n=1 Tax=Stieleria neptunia TaxID=2527979 RepID=A0A518HT32_9BACT|nr:hypothetical protein Enr13x_38470 [Stieleria neptunia]